jgi:hypothetical protein
VTTTAGEVTPLDADLEDSPRCELIWHNLLTRLERQCFRPAAIRLRVTCLSCGRVRCNFYCVPCWDEIRNGNTECSTCGAVVAITAEL